MATMRADEGWMEGRVALVTGAAHGIGRATARRFALEGAAVGLGDRDGEALGAFESELRAEGHRVFAAETDVAVEEDVRRLVAGTVAAFGRLDTLFNNAGIEQPVTPTVDVDEALFDRVIGVNLKGTFFGCKHALPHLEASGGTIVNNASVSAFANVGGNASYAASKGGIMSLTRVLAIEYARRAVRVNAICPGVIDTDMNRRNLELAVDPHRVEEGWRAATPMGRMGTPDEVAWTVLYLASAQSSFTTGVGLLIDGGRVAT